MAGLIMVLVSPAEGADISFGDVSGVEWLDCYDGDTCRFNIPNWPSIIGENISIRLAQIDTPEIRGNCPREKRLARQARDALIQKLSSSHSIVLQNVRRGKYFRILAELEADEVNLGDWLIDQGLARAYHGERRRSWCDVEEGIDPAVLLAMVDKFNEIAVIRNVGYRSVDLTGWVLVSERGNQRFVFPPSTRLLPGESMKVISGRTAIPDPPFRLLWTRGFVWDNDHTDTGMLLDRDASPVSQLPR